MPCQNPDHVHDWPEEGVLVIQKCERYCDFCEGDGADHEWKFPWFLRRHVRNFHKIDYPNLVVSDNWHVDLSLSLPFTTDLYRTTCQDNSLARSSASTPSGVADPKKPKSKTTKKSNTLSSTERSKSAIPVSRIKSKPRQRRKRRRADLSSDTDDDVDSNHPRWSNPGETSTIHDEEADADISMNADLSQESSIVFDPDFSIRLSHGTERQSGSSSTSFRPSTTISQPDSVLVTACESKQGGPTETRRGLRIPIFQVDGQTQFDATTRHYDMLDLKLSWRDGLRELARQGLEAGLYCCEIGVIMADEVDRHIIKNASTGNDTNDTADTSLSSSTSSARQHTTEPKPCRDAHSLNEVRRDSFTEVMYSVLGPKIQAMSEKLNRLVWPGFGESFMRELFVLDAIREPSVALPVDKNVSLSSEKNNIATGSIIDLTEEKFGDAVSGSSQFRGKSVAGGDQVQLGGHEKPADGITGTTHSTEDTNEAGTMQQNITNQLTSVLNPVSGNTVDHRHEMLRSNAMLLPDPKVNHSHLTPALFPELTYSKHLQGPTPPSSSPAYLEPALQRNYQSWTHGRGESSNIFSPSLQQRTPIFGKSVNGTQHMHHSHCHHRPHSGAHATCRHAHAPATTSVGGAMNTNTRSGLQPGQYSFRPFPRTSPTQMGAVEQQQLAVEEAGKQLLAIHGSARHFGDRPVSAPGGVSKDKDD